MTGRLRSLLIGGLVITGAAIAAVSLNLLLLGRASGANDPVGHLQVHTHVPAAPHWTVRPTKGPIEDQGADD